MPKKVEYKIRMRTGEYQKVKGTLIIDDYAYDKRLLPSGRSTYILTHIPTGTLISSSSKVGALKLICQEPEFYEEFDPRKLLRALSRFWNRYGWSEKNVKLK